MHHLHILNPKLILYPCYLPKVVKDYDELAWKMPLDFIVNNFVVINVIFILDTF